MPATDKTTIKKGEKDMTRIDITNKVGELIAVYDSTATVGEIEEGLKANGYAVAETVHGNKAREIVTKAGCRQDDVYDAYIIVYVDAIWW